MFKLTRDLIQLVILKDIIRHLLHPHHFLIRVIPTVLSLVEKQLLRDLESGLTRHCRGM